MNTYELMSDLTNAMHIVEADSPQGRLNTSIKQFLYSALDWRQLAIPIAWQYSNRILQVLWEDSKHKSDYLVIDIMNSLQYNERIWGEKNDNGIDHTST